MSIWTPVIDEMLVYKLAQYSQSICSSCAHRNQSHVAKSFITPGTYRLEYKHPHLATRVTSAAIVDRSILQPMALGLKVYRPSGHNCVHANFCNSEP